jgi:carnitine-CoA ligase
MPYFMVPCDVRFVDTLANTPTERVPNVKLRDEGITGDTSDRDTGNTMSR